MDTHKKYTSRWKKVLAFFIGWFGAGILWSIGSSIGESADVSTNSTFGAICQIVGFILIIWVWARLYRYFVEKWAKDVAVVVQENEKKTYCTNCGMLCEVSAKFCTKCGKILTE